MVKISDLPLSQYLMKILTKKRPFDLVFYTLVQRKKMITLKMGDSKIFFLGKQTDSISKKGAYFPPRFDVKTGLYF